MAVVSGEHLLVSKQSFIWFLGRPVWGNKANLNLHIWIRNIDKTSKRESAKRRYAAVITLRAKAVFPLIDTEIL